MLRQCTRCGRPFEDQDFIAGETEHLESDRKAAGLRGVRFSDYLCPDCGTENVVIEVRQLDGETDAGYQARKESIEAGVKQVEVDAVEVVVAEKRPQDGSGYGA